MATTRLGATGPMAEYAGFAAKEKAEEVRRLGNPMLCGVGRLITRALPWLAVLGASHG